MIISEQSGTLSHFRRRPTGILLPVVLPNIGAAIGLGNADLVQVILNLIKVALSFLAPIAVLFVIFGGFQWMLSAGNDERVEKAKRTISSAVIGLIIVLLSWAIVSFILKTTIQVSS